MAQFLVIDIEALVDLDVWTPPPDIADPFPPPAAWRPICIGCVLIEGAGANDARTLTVKKVGVIEERYSTEPAAIEQSVLQQFADYMAKFSQTQWLITFNGRRYDLPVLIQRSMRQGLQHPWYFNNREMRYRHSEEGHCDLADVIADYGAAPAAKLDTFAKLIGLPGKIGDIDGSKVGEAFAAGRYLDIAAYCLGDTVQTAFLWLRWQMLKGTITPDAYRKAAAELLVASSSHPRLEPMVAAVDRATLLLEGERKAA